MQILPPKEAFLGLEPEDAVGYKEADAVVIPFGLEASVSYGAGTAQGPAAIIAASHEVELFDEELWYEPFRNIGIVTLQEEPVATPIKAALQQLEASVERIIEDKKFPLILGGEHSLTAGAIRPLAAKYDDLILLHFDAHADLRDGYEGEHYSHASAIRRCMDDPNIEVVSIGIRNISAEEVPFLEANNDRLHMYWAHEKDRWDHNEIINRFKGRAVYITFDVDGFDSSLMPATGTPEPGGLFWHEALKIIRDVCYVGNVVAADINELSPIPGNHSCDFLAAKLAYKILSFAFN
ncbi:MAG: agmatinase [Coxiellaceae bacterium]|nr:agmatinase [Coxiellaceae bacterium]